MQWVYITYLAMVSQLPRLKSGETTYAADSGLTLVLLPLTNTSLPSGLTRRPTNQNHLLEILQLSRAAL